MIGVIFSVQLSVKSKMFFETYLITISGALSVLDKPGLLFI